MTVPIVELGGWGPTEAEFMQFWIDEGVGDYVTDPDTGQTVWQFLGIYAGNMTFTPSWSGVMLTGNQHPNGPPPPPDPDNPDDPIDEQYIVDGWHTNIRMFGQSLLEPLTEGLEQYDNDDNLLEVWDRTHLNSRDWWNLNQFPQGIPGLGFPPGWGKPPGQEGVMFSDPRRFVSQSNRWQ